MKKKLIRLTIMIVLALTLVTLYMVINVKFQNESLALYQLKRRIPKLIAILISAFAIGSATIVFQTVINNTIVTPCLLGMNALYTLIYTVVAFLVGATSKFFLNDNLSFLTTLVIMLVVSLIIYGFMFKKVKYNILYILLIGTVLTSLFGSIQSSIVRVMDPNEYDTLLTSLTASFDNVNSSIMIISVLMLLGLIIIFNKELRLLNVLSLGRNQAINLGVDYDKTVRKLLIFVTAYIAIATAMVGPISFLGLITANLARQAFKTYKHKYLITGSVLFSVIVLLIGQMISEHVYHYAIPVSIFITIGGGIYFLYLIIRSRRRV